MATATTTPAIELANSEVRGFAAANGVDDCVPKVIEATRTVFPTAEKVSLYLEDDPEIADERYVIVHLPLHDVSATEAVAARYRWHGELLQSCPSEKVCLFRLRMELKDVTWHP